MPGQILSFNVEQCRGFALWPLPWAFAWRRIRLEMGSTGIMLEESTHFLEGIKWIAHAATSTEHLKDLFHFQLSGGTWRRLRSRGMNSVVVNTWTFLLGRIKKEKEKKRINKQTKLPKCYNPKQNNNGVSSGMFSVWCNIIAAVVGIFIITSSPGNTIYYGNLWNLYQFP